MASLLKSFGRGCLYILVLPLLVVVLAVYAVFGVGMFVVTGIKALFLFFTGRSFDELPEDIKARTILEGKDKEEPIQEEKQDEVKPVDYYGSYYVPIDQSLPNPNGGEVKDNEDKNPQGGEE